MNEYQRRKAGARCRAVMWQLEFEKYNYSYSELAAWGDYFARLGRRFGLLREFRENGFI